MRILMRWLHIFGVIAGIGGTVFVRFALMPVLARLDPQTAQPIAANVIRRYAPIVHTAILAIIVSGLYNFMALAPPPRPETAGLYHPIFGVKVLLALAVFTIAVFATSRKPRPFVQAHRRELLTTNVVLAAIIVALSAFLRTLR